MELEQEQLRTKKRGARSTQGLRVPIVQSDKQNIQILGTSKNGRTMRQITAASEEWVGEAFSWLCKGNRSLPQKTEAVQCS